MAPIIINEAVRNGNSGFVLFFNQLIRHSFSFFMCCTNHFSLKLFYEHHTCKMYYEFLLLYVLLLMVPSKPAYSGLRPTILNLHLFLLQVVIAIKMCTIILSF